MTLLQYFVTGREDLLEMVHIEKSTGEVVVANKIDHEQHPWINLTVKAVDSGEPPRYSLVDLVIQVNFILNLNGEPEFDSRPAPLRFFIPSVYSTKLSLACHIANNNSPIAG